jgi:hypothetical protein
MDEIDLCASPLVGRQVVYSFPDPQSAEVFAYLNGPDIIPPQTKSLLSSGRVSIKTRSKKDFSLLYQDHVCSAILRLARDFLARLPLKTILLHGFAPDTDTATGNPTERCVISCILNREKMDGIDFNKIDPIDCLSNFPHAMKTLRGMLVEVAPLTLVDIANR